MADASRRQKSRQRISAGLVCPWIVSEFVAPDRSTQVPAERRGELILVGPEHVPSVSVLPIRRTNSHLSIALGIPGKAEAG